MNLYVADTHMLFWHLIDSPRLGKTAAKVFAEAENGKALVHIPAIVIAELYFLNEKLGQPINFSDWFEDLRTATQFVLVPFNPDDVLGFEADATVTEMHDRIIVGVARRLGATLLTVDHVIVESGLVKTLS